MPVEETVRAFDALVRAGKVRYVAASNLSGERLRESLEVAAREGLAPYVWLQPHYNLVERERYEREFAPIVAEHGLAVAPYYALAKRLSDRQVPARRRRRRAARGPRARARTSTTAASRC